MPEPPVIDAIAIANLRSLETDGQSTAFLTELVGLFVTDIPERIAELERALRSSDAAASLRAAHSIKGSSGNLGASALRLAAERLEHCLRQAPGGDIGPLVAALKLEFARARAELEALLEKK